MTKYRGRTALVVDGTSGIGLAVAKRLAEGGAKILLTGRTPAHLAHASAELGICAQVFTLADTDLAAAVEARLGRIDYLFLAAGRATVLALRPVLKDGGAVVFTTAGPHSRRQALRALAAELGDRGIRVNAVAPDCAYAAGTDAAARAALFLAADAPYTTCAQLPVETTQF
ncbi:SDR family NAD(P)-dependent oxidoreductase [Streptomyces sp. NPDC050738]|uniref:SDR family NAD(P)-dependent oxidoreductase n=1 Tax=Streptomyces sp. NPDC050738 TaxID=3154744 RepID=UPI0034267D0B